MPKPKKTSEPEQSGAPINAVKLEKHAAIEEARITQLRSEIERVESDIPKHDGDEAKQKSLRDRLTQLEKQLNDSYQRYIALSKQVLDYDKKVDLSRREGETIPRSEVEKILVNTWRFQRIGRESFIVSIAQDAIRCKDEQDFYFKYAEAIRNCESNALLAGMEHEKFPAWIRDCFIRSS